MIALRLPQGRLRVLALGAHPDDIEIGCGGFLLALGDRPGLDLAGVVLTGVGGRLEEARAALTQFVPGARFHHAGLPDGRLPAHWAATKEYLEEIAAREAPDVVLAPRVEDAHQDHRLLGRLVSTVWRDTLLLHYEIPKWDGDLGRPTHYAPLTDDQARRKVELLHRCYPSQAGRDWWDDETFFGLMRLRGVECRHRYAEGFFAGKVVVEVCEGGRA